MHIGSVGKWKWKSVENCLTKLILVNIEEIEL